MSAIHLLGDLLSARLASARIFAAAPFIASLALTSSIADHPSTKTKSSIAKWRDSAKDLADRLSPAKVLLSISARISTTVSASALSSNRLAIHPRFPIPSPALVLSALNGFGWFAVLSLAGVPAGIAIGLGLISAFGAAVMFGAVQR